MENLRGQKVLITGASRGLGRALAEGFAREGCRLILVARSGKLLTDLRDDLVDRHSIECEVRTGDITSGEYLDDLCRFAAESAPDILVNNAGRLSMDRLEDAEPERIRSVIDLNLTAPVFLTRALIPGFRNRRSGTIVNINSIAGKKPAADHTVYTATKFGLRGFAEALREETLGTGIRILNIYPGKMETDLFIDDGKTLDSRSFMPPAEIARYIISLVKMDRRCSPSELVIERTRTVGPG